MKGIVYITILFFIFLAKPLGAQEQVVMTKNYLFEDGLYLSFEDFKNNKPVYKWSEVKVNLFQNPLNFTAKSDHVFYIVDEDKELKEVWGFSIDGVPYINLNLENEVLERYAGMRVRGKICYYNYDKEQSKTAAISAYNPLTREPFRTAEVSVSETVRHEMMLRLEDGMTEYFKVENFKHWIKDDIQLTATLTDLKQEEVAEKLFKCLLIYNDRNEVMVNKTAAENKRK